MQPPTQHHSTRKKRLPTASRMVYRDGPAGHRSVGLDVTVQVKMEAAAVRAAFAQHKLLRCVLEMAEVSFVAIC